MIDPYEQDEWYDMDEDVCDYCGTPLDGDGWCPFCDYPYPADEDEDNSLGDFVPA